MHSLLGSSAGGMSRSRSLLEKNNFVHGAQAINHIFTDSGIFGLTVEGPGSHSQELMSVVTEELNGLKHHIDDAELSRAKNILKMSVL